MPCALTAGYILDCKESLGGLKSIRLVEWDNLDSTTVVAGVSTVTMDASKKFWKYELVSQTSSWTETITANVQNGTVFYQQEVTMVLNKMKASTRNEILLIAKNRLAIIVEDMNGTYWLIGRVNAADLTAGNGTSGTSNGDRNGYTLTFTAMEAEPAPTVTSANVATITN